jgi:hypothetical protein
MKVLMLLVLGLSTAQAAEPTGPVFRPVLIRVRVELVIVL